MIHDLLIIVILFAWSFARIIQKKLLKTPNLKGFEFAKWTIIIGGILFLPLIPFVKLSPLNIMLGIFLASILWIFEQFPKFVAVKKEEVSRLMAFSHFKFLFAMVLTIVFLKETATINIILGGILMIAGGTFIGLEKGYFKKIKVSNIALSLFLLSMLVSGVAYFWRQFLLQKADPISIMFFSTIFAAILIAPTIKKKPNIPNFKLFLFAQFLMAYGFLLLLWILSKQELVLTVPLLAIQPLVILILGRGILKESKGTLLTRFIGIISIVLGYVLLKGWIF
jgi:drug/metabolite transporter (DMT)-like permease